MRWGLLSVGLGVASAAILALATALPAQTPSLSDQRDRLAQARAQSKAAAARSAALERAAAKARDAANAAKAKEAAVSARIQGAEADISAAQARIAIVDRLLSYQQVQLAQQQSTIVRLIAVLQSMARRPALLNIVQPGSTDDIVHVRAVLGTLTPVIDARTSTIRSAIDRSRKLRVESGRAVEALADARKRYQAERLELARVEAENRLRSRNLGRSALVESDRAIALGERARDIVDQMAIMGKAAAVEGDLAKLSGPLPRPPQPGEAKDPNARPIGAGDTQPYRLPVTGDVIRGFGELSDSGYRSRGVTLSTWAGAKIVAPATGRVVYAGHFRDYGDIVVIDHGGGWNSLITGLSKIDVKRGAVVKQGALLGRAPESQGSHVSVELRRKGVAVDFVPLLG